LVQTGVTREELQAAVEEMQQQLQQPPPAAPQAPGYVPPPLPPLSPQTFNEPLVNRGVYEDGYYLTNRFIVNDNMDGRLKESRKREINLNRTNFIVDPKTSSIAMVVEADILPKLKELIRRLDVPIKMVQLEVMLFEKKLTKNESIGLNLLRIGACASQTHGSC